MPVNGPSNNVIVPHEGLGAVRGHRDEARVDVIVPHEGLGGQVVRRVLRDREQVIVPHEGLGDQGNAGVDLHLRLVIVPHEGLGAQQRGAGERAPGR